MGLLGILILKIGGIMKQILTGLMIIILFITAFLSYQPVAETRLIEESAVVLFMQGDVKVKKMGLIEWEYAEEGMVLCSGDQLKTGADSWAEIGLGEDHRNVVRIQEETLIELAVLGSAEINLLKGELRALVEKLRKDETFEIMTPTAVCGARGTGLDTITDGIKSVVDVYEDSIYFASKSKPKEGLIIKTGKRGILEDPAKPITIKDVPIAKMRDWERWKKDFLQRRDAAKGIKGKIEKIEQGQKDIQDIMKGKQGVFEKKDKNYMDDRKISSDDGQ